MLKIITKKRYESLLNQIENLKKENEKLQVKNANKKLREIKEYCEKAKGNFAINRVLNMLDEGKNKIKHFSKSVFTINEMAENYSIPHTTLYAKINRNKANYEKMGYITIDNQNKNRFGNGRIYITEKGKEFFKDIYMKG